MAAGTVLSRATGFARVLAIGYALGFNRLSDAYNLANTLPNIVYELVLGGVVSATLVPLFVGLFEGDDEDPWRGVAAVTWLVLAVTAGLSLLFAVGGAAARGAVRGAQPHVRRGRAEGADRRVDALLRAAGRAARGDGGRIGHPQRATAIRRADVRAGAQQRRGHRGDPRRAALHQRTRAASRCTSVAASSFSASARRSATSRSSSASFPSLRSVGARLRPVWDPHHPAVRRAARLSGWTVGFVLANQVAYLIVVALANKRSGELSIYQAAFQFFQLPSRRHRGVDHRARCCPSSAPRRRRRDDAAFDALFRRGLRVIAVLLIPAALVAVFFAEPMLRPLIAHGRLTDQALHTTARRASSAFALGLPGFSAFILCTRAFQARQDTRRVFYLYVFENAHQHRPRARALSVAARPRPGVRVRDRVHGQRDRRLLWS